MIHHRQRNSRFASIHTLERVVVVVVCDHSDRQHIRERGCLHIDRVSKMRRAANDLRNELRILNSATKIRLDHRRSNLTHTPGIGAGFAAVNFCTPHAVCGNSTQCWIRY